MALPLSNAAAEDGDEHVDGFDTTGYARLPVDHLSDSSESSNGISGDLADDMSLQVENWAALRDVGAGTHSHRSIPRRTGAFNGMQVQAEIHNEGINDGSLHRNGGHVPYVNGMENQAATEAAGRGISYQNGNHATSADGMENQGEAGNGDMLHDNVVHIDGMEIHVYSQLAGLQLSLHVPNNWDKQEDIDDEDDVDECERQHAEDAAFQRAKEADDTRRLAPLPPDRCQAIKEAMQSVSLGGFQPEWADKVPEEQWVSRLRRK